MRVILDATGYSPSLAPLIEHRPTPLFRIADKPILVHIIEYLASEGFQDIQIILSHLPKEIEDRLHEGKRWGITLTYHLAREPSKPFSVLVPVARGWQEQLLVLGRADVLPKIHLKELASQIAKPPLLLFDQHNQWTGWGLFSSEQITHVNPELSYFSLAEHFAIHHQIFTTHPLAAATSFSTLHRANMRFLQENSPLDTVPSSARMVEPGVWLSRSVVLHPSAKIIPPIYIGEGCQILADTQIGPHAMIENHCMIDRSSTVENSLICQKSYIGQKLEIKDSIVDKNVLVNLSLETTVRISDTFILAHLKAPSFSQQLFHILERLIALGLGTILLPLWLPLTFFWGVRSIDVVQLPASIDPDEWRIFTLYRFDKPRSKRFTSFWKAIRQLPSLWNIAAGKCHFVGVTPLTKEQVKQLPSDWRSLYLNTKVGLVTLAFVDHGSNPSNTDRFASETFYAAHMNVRFDLYVLFQWFLRRSKKLLGIHYYP